jgi:streptomycin 6-kinase
MNIPVDKQIEVICCTLQRAWMPLPHGMHAMTGSEKAQNMAAYVQLVWPKLGEPSLPRAVAVALRFAKARRDAFDPATAVIGQGDAHAWNTLHDPKLGNFKFVDPDGLFIERAHDLSISMREWSTDLLAGDPVTLGKQRCELLADLAGVDPGPIWQWGFVERLVNGLLYLERGPAENAAEFLNVVEAWAMTEPV